MFDYDFLATILICLVLFVGGFYTCEVIMVARFTSNGSLRHRIRKPHFQYGIKQTHQCGQWRQPNALLRLFSKVEDHKTWLQRSLNDSRSAEKANDDTIQKLESALEALQSYLNRLRIRRGRTTASREPSKRDAQNACFQTSWIPQLDMRQMPYGHDPQRHLGLRTLAHVTGALLRNPVPVQDSSLLLAPYGTAPQTSVLHEKAMQPQWPAVDSTTHLVAAPLEQVARDEDVEMIDVSPLSSPINTAPQASVLLEQAVKPQLPAVVLTATHLVVAPMVQDEEDDDIDMIDIEQWKSVWTTDMLEMFESHSIRASDPEKTLDSEEVARLFEEHIVTGFDDSISIHESVTVEVKNEVVEVILALLFLSAMLFDMIHFDHISLLLGDLGSGAVPTYGHEFWVQRYWL
ncbi:hypothetical protein B0H66DRAFT_526549 [Apodospora peruviana]|uniref:Uncharacterized protein n=1 Tax=Apodospora peruviana TaxID=516989 RepID=A0AAE0IQM0_9PEZI|nr:hypothetical protein B0H66DRAFT_526549 [Apodospora peruviana]